MPQNGFSLNDLKKIKSLTGKERIPVYTTTKSIPTKFTTVDDILAEVDAQVSVDNVTITGLGTDANPLVATYQAPEVDGTTVTGTGTVLDPLVATYQAPEVDGVTITGTGAPGDPLIASTSGGGDLNYSSVAFVDRINGNNATAVAGNASKPFLTVTAAISAVSGSATSTAPVLVYLRAGDYPETITLKNHVHVYCEPGVMFTSYLSGFIDDTAGTTTKVFGYAKFDLDSKALIVQYASDIQFECDEIYGNSSSYFIIPVYIGSQTVTPKVRLFANRIYHNGKNGDCISMRYNFDIVINVKNEIRGLNKVLRFFQATGKANITCPKIVADASAYNNVWTYKAPIQCQSNTATLRVVVNGDLISESTTYGSQGSIQTYQGSTARIELNGNIYATNSIGVHSQNLSGTDYGTIVVNGNIYSNVVPVAANSNGIIVVNGNCIKTADVNYLYQAVSLYGGSPSVYINNGYLYTNETNIDCVNIASSTAKLYLYDCKGYNNGTGYFINSAATIPTVGMVNTKANGALSANVTDSFSPTGFAQITGLVLPIF